MNTGQGNHWTVFNGAGAVVADNMPLDVVQAYLTPARFDRGWMAAYCITVRTEDELRQVEQQLNEQSDGPTGPASFASGQMNKNDPDGQDQSLGEQR